MSKVMILGGDGYLGWPTCMYLTERGHEVVGVDMCWKRTTMSWLNIKPLLPDLTFRQRVTRWCQKTGLDMHFSLANVAGWQEFEPVFRLHAPDVVIHYAEQPSAPFSMMNHAQGCNTVINNVLTTMHVVHAVRKYAPKAHIIKLGTMGEYGTPNIDIEEGWLDIEHKGRRDRLLYPKTPGSIYHLSKVMDSDLLAFATRTWDLAVTDLNQGFVYGNGDIDDDKMKPRFCYDAIFGTALNRFIVQAAIEHPLTVYGAGGQTRGMLNLVDTLQCVELALKHPAKAGEFRVMNQFTEQHSILDIARMVEHTARTLGLKTCIDHIANPRKEQEQHYYNAANTKLRDLGLKPRLLTHAVIAELIEWVLKHKANVRPNQILPTVKW